MRQRSFSLRPEKTKSLFPRGTEASQENTITRFFWLLLHNQVISADKISQKSS